MKRLSTVAAVLGAVLMTTPASAQTKVTIVISGWTGFAPLTLAKEAGIFANKFVLVSFMYIV
jgi:NitT/TauT family transport system substrate-binding protein